MQTPWIDQLTAALSWTFLHSLWQGLVLTVLAALLLVMTRRSTAAFRYALLCLYLFLFIGAAALTFWLEWRAAAQIHRAVPGIVPGGGSFLMKDFFAQVKNFLDVQAPLITLGWLLIAVYKSLKLAADMRYIRRLRGQSQPLRQGDWFRRVRSLGCGLGIGRPVLMAESLLVKAPVVIGYFKPLILMPAGMVTQLPAVELEAILLHELAHIRRHDYLVNFLQRIGELVFFFNPGFLWVSSLLRSERENCCDDVAIAGTNPFQFAQALIHCRERLCEAPAFSLGLLGKNLLVHRLTRIVERRNGTLSASESLFSVLSLAVLLGWVMGYHHPNGAPEPRLEASSPQRLSEIPTAYFQTSDSIVPSEKAILRPVKKSSTIVREKRLVKAVAVKETAFISRPVAEEGKSGGLTTFDTYASGFTAYKAAEDAYVKHGLQRQREEMEEQRLQAEKDREQAMRDREQAIKDRQQAEKDRLQALKDRAQAQKDRERAERDRRAHYLIDKSQ